MRHSPCWAAILASLALVAGAASAQYAIPTDETGNWKVLLSADGVISNLSTVAEGPEEKTCVKLTFIFTGQQEEFLLIHAPLPQPLSDEYLAAKLTYRTDLQPGMDGPLVFLNEKSAANYTIDPSPPAAPEWRTLYLPLSMFKATDFAPDNNGKLDLAEVNEFRLALHAKLEGKPAQGTLWVNEVEFVKEVPEGNDYPPRDFVFMGEKGATGAISSPEEGPEGERVTRMDFTLPPGEEAHAIAVSRLNGARDVVGKAKVRVTFKTLLPNGVEAVILILAESGGAGYAALLPGSAEWTTKEITMANMIRGDWAEDENGKLDTDQVIVFGFGTGGKVVEPAGGTIWIKEYAFVE
jgi:hypothetical protein